MSIKKDRYIPGMKQNRILENDEMVLRVVEDTYDGTYSIGIETKNDSAHKMVSKKLHDLLLKELM